MNLRSTLALLGLLAAVLLAPAPASAHEVVPRALIPRCTDISFKGDAGQINIRSSPTRAIAWNVATYDSRRNDGPWIADVYVNNRRVDHKEQAYQPHGSINPVDLPPSSFVSIEAWHTDLLGTGYHFVPHQCHLP